MTSGSAATCHRQDMTQTDRLALRYCAGMVHGVRQKWISDTDETAMTSRVIAAAARMAGITP
jgi:hypothetical protein